MFGCRLLLGLLCIAGIQAQRAWETCSVVEGKGGGCEHGDRPRVFKEYLVPGAWVEPAAAGFSYEFQGVLKSSQGPVTASWVEIGSFGPHRIRQVFFFTGGEAFAGLLLAEGSPGIFSPLIKWSGQMPNATFHQVAGSRILVVQKNFGGNVPMVSAWPWIWASNGPMRLDLPAAFHEAIEKVAPGYSSYGAELDWDTLHWQAGVWKGDYPGKVGVADVVEAWFQPAGDALVVQRAEFRELFGSNPRIVRWPK